jgi:hypothetical protein
MTLRTHDSFWWCLAPGLLLACQPTARVSVENSHPDAARVAVSGEPSISTVSQRRDAGGEPKEAPVAQAKAKTDTGKRPKHTKDCPRGGDGTAPSRCDPRFRDNNPYSTDF